MDITIFLYICRKCGKQKKPTEEYCEACRAKQSQYLSPPSHAVQPKPRLAPAPKEHLEVQPQARQITNPVSSANPVAHLSTELQQKLAERAEEQEKYKRSSGTAEPARYMPLISAQQGTLQKHMPIGVTKPSPVVLGRNTKTEKEITITIEERMSGMNVLGATGTGKSTLLTGIFLGDLHNGHGGLFVDVDGDSIDQLLPRIPQERMHDVILLDLNELAKIECYIGINPLPALNKDTETDVDTDAAIDRYMRVFKLLWNIGKDTPRLENTLRASLLTLAINGLTIAEMPSLLRDKEVRKRCIDAIPVIFATEGLRSFWQHDFDALYMQEQLKYADSTLNKVLQFLMVRKVLYAVSQGKTTVDFRAIMDMGKIVLLKLSPQELGETAVRFLGTFLMAELKNALFSRGDLQPSDRAFFSCVFDEWQLYITADFKDILTRGRKYGVGVSAANQTFSQLDEIDTALQGITKQVNTHITFAVNEKDAAILAPYYAHDPQPEMRQEYAPIISPTPVDTVVLRRPHKDNFVNEFFKPWREMVRTAHSLVREGETPGSSSSVTSTTRRGVTRTSTYTRPGHSWSNREEVEAAQASLDIMNGFLHEVMVGKNPFCVVPHSLFQTWCYGLYSSQLGEYGIWLTQTIIDHQVRQPTDTQLSAYNALWEAQDEKSLGVALRAYEQETRRYFHTELTTAVTDFVERVRIIASVKNEAPQQALRSLETSRIESHVYGFFENNWDALRVDAFETIYHCQTIPTLPITPTLKAFPRPLYRWEWEGGKALKPLLEEIVAFIVPFMLERKIQYEVDCQTRFYGGPKSQDSFWSKIRQNPTIRENSSYLLV